MVLVMGGTIFFSLMYLIILLLLLSCELLLLLQLVLLLLFLLLSLLLLLLIYYSISLLQCIHRTQHLRYDVSSILHNLPIEMTMNPCFINLVFAFLDVVFIFRLFTICAHTSLFPCPHSRLYPMAHIIGWVEVLEPWNWVRTTISCGQRTKNIEDGSLDAIFI